MERLCDVAASRLVITCGPCERRGVYDVGRLRARMGDHASMLDVYLRLTQSCRRKPAEGEQTGCRAEVTIAGPARPTGLPSRT